MTAPRTLIRQYAWAMLKADIKGVKSDNIFLSRPNAAILETLPCINIFFAAEPVEVSEGDRYVPQQYERKLSLAIEIGAEQPNDPEGLMRVEDVLDEIGKEVEDAFLDDNFFEKRFPNYDPEVRLNEGLLAGTRLLSVMPGTAEYGDRAIAFQQIIFELTYVTDAYVSHRYKIFEEYLLEIRRVGYDDDTVDPILIAAEGEL